MKCKYFKIRSKNNKKEKRIYNYCTLYKVWDEDMLKYKK